MHGTRNRREYRHCKKPPNDKPLSEEEIQAVRFRTFRQHIAHLMRRNGFSGQRGATDVVAPQNVSRTPRDLENVVSNMACGAGLGWQFDAPMALREYARFVEDAVLCRRVERAKTRVRELSAFINGPRDVSARVGVGESRIRSTVKRPTLRVASCDTPAQWIW